MGKGIHRAGIAAAAVVPLVAAGLTVAGPASAQDRHAVRGSQPRYATASNRTGAADSSAAVQARVWLHYNHASAERALLAAITDRSSKSYGRYLTAKQFNQRFRPTSGQVKAVTSWLGNAGLTVTAVPSTHRFVAFKGTVAKVSKAFGTTYGNYRYQGHTYRAPDRTASVPASLGNVVLTVSGLDSMPHMAKPARTAPFPPPPGFRNGRPCSKYFNQQKATLTADGNPIPAFQGQQRSFAICGYTPPQLRGAYGLDPAVADGAGIHVAVVDAYAASTILNDANTYISNHDRNMPSLFLGQNFFNNAPAEFFHGQECGGNGWFGEETLDIEAVHSMAPGATIHYYGAKSCFDTDLMDSVQQAMNEGVDVITNSYGELELAVPPDLLIAQDQQYQQAAIEGITVSFSSGDSGDEAANTGGFKSVDSSASDPYVTAVGGTALGIGKSNNVVFETGWGTEKYSSPPTPTATPRGRRSVSSTAPAAASATSSTSRRTRTTWCPTESTRDSSRTSHSMVTSPPACSSVRRNGSVRTTRATRTASSGSAGRACPRRCSRAWSRSPTGSRPRAVTATSASPTRRSTS